MLIPMAMGVVVTGHEGTMQLSGKRSAALEKAEVRGDCRDQVNVDAPVCGQGRGHHAGLQIREAIDPPQPFQQPMQPLHGRTEQTGRSEPALTAPPDGPASGCNNPGGVVGRRPGRSGTLHALGDQPGIGTHHVHLPSLPRQSGQELGVTAGLDPRTARRLQGEQQNLPHRLTPASAQRRLRESICSRSRTCWIFVAREGSLFIFRSTCSTAYITVE